MSLILVLNFACGSGGSGSSVHWRRRNAHGRRRRRGTPASAGGTNRLSPTLSWQSWPLENTEFSEVIGNTTDAPFLNSLVNYQGSNPSAPGALATNYFADAHPSIGNYFMMTTGQLVTTDDTFNPTSSGYPVTVDNVVRELTAAGKTWKVYAESLPSIGYTGGDVVPYLERHNPISYFSDVVGNPQQSAKIVPFTQFAADLNAGPAGTLGNLPNYAFIVPKFAATMRRAAIRQNRVSPNCIAAADSWVQANIGPLLQTPAFQQSGLLIITWDEGALTDASNG